MNRKRRELESEKSPELVPIKRARKIVSSRKSDSSNHIAYSLSMPGSKIEKNNLKEWGNKILIGNWTESHNPDELKTIQFGSTFFKVYKLDEPIVNRNIKTGQQALSRIMGKIIKPGVLIEPKKGVPLYYADPTEKGVIIRNQDGKLQKGTFKNGRFIKCRSTV